MRASVAMAVYNGEKYIDAQIQSITKQLTDDDELIISYNISTDNTLGIIQDYARKDQRIRIFICEKEGIKENFTNAVMHCSGSWIFYSDQDDVWAEDKLERVMTLFNEKKVSLVVHNARYTDADLNALPTTIFEDRRTHTGIIRNIVKGGYFGCCMAFSSDLVKYIFPIPDDVPSYDMWTGLIAEMCGKIALLNKELVYHRLHDNNMTPDRHSPLLVMAQYRIALVRNLARRRRRISRDKKNTP